jgi:hypothetical protein
VYALNCLIHLCKRELPSVLTAISRILKPDGLFFMGMYGGIDREGIWAQDPYNPKRFFAFYEDTQLKQIVCRVFNLESFRKIDIGQSDAGLYFQSLILRKRENC